MPKFFIEKSDIDGDNITLAGENARHIGKVLRGKIGDEITLCDGYGTDYTARILNITKGEIIAEVLKSYRSNSEADIDVILIQGLPRSDKMDYIIQKCTEVGICKIIPCKMERCVVKLDTEKDVLKKTERWQRIAKEAAQQSGRGVIPKIENPVDFNIAIDILKKSDICFAAYEGKCDYTLKQVLNSSKGPKTVGFIIGPEGGFDDREVSAIINSGIKTVSLGNRILRCETAGAVVTAIVMYEIGDINTKREGSG